MRRPVRLEEVSTRPGAKLTRRRMEIFREGVQTGGHSDTERVFDAVQEWMPTLSADTIYRMFRWLKDVGPVTRRGPARERARFDADFSRHHHCKCTRCGLGRDFFRDGLDTKGLSDSVLSVGYAGKVRVEINGIRHTGAPGNKPGAKINEERREA